MQLRLFSVSVLILTFAFVAPSAAQINNLTREELIRYTASNPFDRFPDGRPKVPDALLEAFKDMSSEEVMGAGRPPGAAPSPAPAGRQPNVAVTYTDGWEILNPGVKLIG